MIVYAYKGSFLPSKLAGELRAAGIDVAGVSATDDASGDVVAVQVIVADNASEKAVAAIVKAHDPTPTPVAPSRRDELVSKLKDGTITAPERDELLLLLAGVNA